MASVLVINGPNLNLLGTRDPAVYGSKTLGDVERMCRGVASELGLSVEFRQSNHEGELVDWVQQAGPECQAGRLAGVVLNAGAYSHSSLALQDAISSVKLRVVEVHISNVYAREEFRHRSLISPVASGVIVGFGTLGYPLAIRALHELARTG